MKSRHSLLLSLFLSFTVLLASGQHASADGVFGTIKKGINASFGNNVGGSWSSKKVGRATIPSYDKATGIASGTRKATSGVLPRGERVQVKAPPRADCGATGAGGVAGVGPLSPAPISTSARVNQETEVKKLLIDSYCEAQVENGYSRTPLTVDESQAKFKECVNYESGQNQSINDIVNGFCDVSGASDYNSCVQQNLSDANKLLTDNNKPSSSPNCSGVQSVKRDTGSSNKERSTADRGRRDSNEQEVASGGRTELFVDETGQTITSDGCDVTNDGQAFIACFVSKNEGSTVEDAVGTFCDVGFNSPSFAFSSFTSCQQEFSNVTIETVADNGPAQFIEEEQVVADNPITEREQGREREEVTTDLDGQIAGAGNEEPFKETGSNTVVSNDGCVLSNDAHSFFDCYKISNPDATIADAVGTYCDVGFNSSSFPFSDYNSCAGEFSDSSFGQGVGTVIPGIVTEGLIAGTASGFVDFSVRENSDDAGREPVSTVLLPASDNPNALTGSGGQRVLTPEPGTAQSGIVAGSPEAEKLAKNVLITAVCEASSTPDNFDSCVEYETGQEQSIEGLIGNVCDVSAGSGSTQADFERCQTQYRGFTQQLVARATSQ